MRLLQLEWFAMALVVAGCTHLNQWQVHDEFQGIGPVFQEARELDVLIIHGMGQAMEGMSTGPLNGYSRQLQTRLAHGVGIGNEHPTQLHVVTASGVPIGSVAITSFGDDSRRLTFYEVSWAEAVKPMKLALLELADGKFRETSPLENQRAPLNSAAKAFLNTHLADPLIYSGAFGPAIREVASQAICLMTRGSPMAHGPCDFRAPAKSAAPIAMITISLGSAIVFDTILELSRGTPDERAAAIQVAGATRHAYMFANQVPLLELRDVSTPSSPGWLDEYPCRSNRGQEAAAALPERGFGGFVQLRRQAMTKATEAGATLPVLAVTAFNDPNDVLTYFFTQRFKNHCADVQFSNVTVTNAETLWLFLAADPVVAHTGYKANSRVIDLVLHGAAQ